MVSAAEIATVQDSSPSSTSLKHSSTPQCTLHTLTLDYMPSFNPSPFSVWKLLSPTPPPKKKMLQSSRNNSYIPDNTTLDVVHTQRTPYDKLPTELSCCGRAVNHEYLKYGTFRAIGRALSYSRVNVIFVLNISKSLLSCLQRLCKHGSVSKYHRMSKKKK